MSKLRLRTRAAIPLVAVACALSGCTNLTAVNRWASTSMEATRFNEIVSAYATMPQRVTPYDPAGAEQWAQQAQIREAQAEALNGLLAVVADYMAALAALADDGVADPSKELGSVTKMLSKTGAVSPETLGAAGKITSLVAKAAAELWQKRKVRRLIEDANAPLQVILGGELRTIVSRDFARDLQIETGLVNGYYKHVTRTGGCSADAKVALEQWKQIRVDDLETREKAQAAYVEVLSKISEGHQALYDGRKDLGAKDLVKELSRLTYQIRKNARTLAKARG